MRQVEKGPEAERDETPLERVDRNMVELLNELRVALPGVQVLFAFLLVLPFNQGFTSVTDFQKTVYLLTLLATAAAAICLIAPAIHHRIQFRANKKTEILRDANRLTIAGLSFMALGMTGAVMLVTDYVFDGATMIACVVAVAVAFLLIWFVLPIRHLLGAERR